MRQTFAACCARATSGQAAADPTIPLIKSRRCIASPKAYLLAPTVAQKEDYSRDFDRTELGSLTVLQSSNSWDRMFALGQKQTLADVRVMSALPPKADIG
jgi:uncharacterized protein YchJ